MYSYLKYQILYLLYYVYVGAIANFNTINHAYNALLALQAEEDEKNGSVSIDFDAEVKKGGEGIGLGLVVYEVSKCLYLLLSYIV